MLSDTTTWLIGVLEMPPAHMVEPWVIALTLAALTLLIEDAAIAAGILLAGDGTIGWPLAFVAVAGGIAGGDMLLYLLGTAARRIAPTQHHLAKACHAHRVRRLLDRNMAVAVLIARVVPGLRLAVYTAFGLFSLPFKPFALLVLAAVAAWTGILFLLGSIAGAVLMQQWGVPTWQVAIGLFLMLTLFAILVRRLGIVTDRVRQ